MTWTVNQPCEVEVTRGKWVAGIVISVEPEVRVKTADGDLVRPKSKGIREPKASSSLRHAVPPPSTEAAEAAAHERVTMDPYLRASLDRASAMMADSEKRRNEAALEAVMRVIDRPTAMLKAVPKPVTPRSESHLDAVRSKPCCNCGADGPSDPHHFDTGGMGITCSDYYTAPLCRMCHGPDVRLGNAAHLPGKSHDESVATLLKAALDICAERLWRATTKKGRDAAEESET